MKKLCVLLLALTLSGCSLLDVLSEPAVDLNGGGVDSTFSPSNETMNYHYHQLSEEEPAPVWLAAACAGRNGRSDRTWSD